MPRPSGRATSRRYRRNRALMLAENDICGICDHDGARTADHKIARERWLELHGTLDGFDDIENLQPAHGTMGSRAINPCPTCNRLCNQSRGAKPLGDVVRTPHSREW